MKQVNRIIDGQLVQIDVWESSPGVTTAKAWLSGDVLHGCVGGCAAGDAPTQMGRWFDADRATEAAAIEAVCTEVQTKIVPASGELPALLVSMVRSGDAVVHRQLN